ncbi:MAG: ATP-binding protein [Calditrichia bacterium]
MFKTLTRLDIQKKIILIPVIAGVIFSFSTVIILLMSQNNEENAQKIQNYYYPLLALNFEVEERFSFIQRELQDAVAAADSEAVAETEQIYKGLIDTLMTGASQFEGERDSLLLLHEKCKIYFVVASSVSYRLISERASKSLIDDIEHMSFLYNQLTNSIVRASNRHREAIESRFLSNRANYSRLLWFSFLLTFFGLTLIIVISYITTKSITKPLSKLVELANVVAQGKFNTPVTVSGQGEIGVLEQAFNKMTKEIGTLIREKDKAFQTVILSKSFIEQNAQKLENLNSDLKVEIDERKKAEAKLNDHQLRLEEKVRERTAKLSTLNLNLQEEIETRKQFELKQMQLNSALESANQELKSFAYVVSHDLKAPLRAIGSLSDWLANDYKQQLGDEGKNLLNLLDGRVIRMHNLIEGILEYSRLGRIREEKSRIDLNVIMEIVLDVLAPPAHIQVSIPNKFPSLVFERTRLIQVFQNLIGNAIKYNDKPEGRVDVAFTKSERNWLFSISDNGVGIDQRHFGKVFQIFQTLKARDEYESTGVGLTLVKRIIEMYGGEIWIESELGIGTTFFFTIPITEGDEIKRAKEVKIQPQLPERS